MANLKDDTIDSTLSALQEAIENKKTQIQNAREQRESVHPVMSNLLSEIFHKAKGSYTQINGALEYGEKSAQAFVKKVQEDIQEKPWDVVRKVAISSFVIGLFLSLNQKRSTAGEKE